MPQAGVALGLIAVASSMVPDYAPQLRTVILCSTFIYSIIGPGVAKFSLVKAGEIVLPDKSRKSRNITKACIHMQLLSVPCFTQGTLFSLFYTDFANLFLLLQTLKYTPNVL